MTLQCPQQQRHQPPSHNREPIHTHDMCCVLLGRRPGSIPTWQDCLYSLSDSITASNGVCITDKLRFFVGDHPAKQFECGTQQGGTGGRGVHSTMMGDLAHTLQLPWQSLYDLQQIAVAGKYGRHPKAFDNLKVRNLKRHDYETDKCKDDLDHALKSILKGVQRVPTLLLLNPTGKLSDLNITQY